LEREQVSKKFLEDEVKALTEDLSVSENQCHVLMQEIDSIRVSQMRSSESNEI